MYLLGRPRRNRRENFSQCLKGGTVCDPCNDSCCGTCIDQGQGLNGICSDEGASTSHPPICGPTGSGICPFPGQKCVCNYHGASPTPSCECSSAPGTTRPPTTSRPPRTSTTRPTTSRPPRTSACPDLGNCTWPKVPVPNGSGCADPRGQLACGDYCGLANGSCSGSGTCINLNGRYSCASVCDDGTTCPRQGQSGTQCTPNMHGPVQGWECTDVLGA